MKWVPVATAPNETIGESWVFLLRQKGIPAYVRTEALGVYVGVGTQPVRIMVPADRADEGKAALEESIGPDESPPGPEAGAQA